MGPARLDVHPHTGDRRSFTVAWFLPYNYQAGASPLCTERHGVETRPGASLGGSAGRAPSATLS